MRFSFSNFNRILNQIIIIIRTKKDTKTILLKTLFIRLILNAAKMYVMEIEYYYVFVRTIFHHLFIFSLFFFFLERERMIRIILIKKMLMDCKQKKLVKKFNFTMKSGFKSNWFPDSIVYASEAYKYAELGRIKRDWWENRLYCYSLQGLRYTFSVTYYYELLFEDLR